MHNSPTKFLIDLISLQHKKLRGIIAERWQNEFDFNLSASEWYLLSNVVNAPYTISQVANIIGISRQAAQKSVQRLSALDMVEVEFQTGNKRDKYISLTAQGKRYYQHYLELKQELELELQQQWGTENVALMRKLLANSMLDKE